MFFRISVHLRLREIAGQRFTVAQVAHEKRIDRRADHFPHALAPFLPAFGIDGNIAFVQHPHLNMGHILHLLGKPLLAQPVGNFGKAVRLAEGAGLLRVVGNDHDQVLALGGGFDDLVKMASVRR